MAAEDARRPSLFLLDVAIKVSFPVLLGVAGWTFTSLQDHEKRLTTIEASRYSSKDAEVDRRATQSVLESINIRMAESAADRRNLMERLSRIDEAVQKIAQGK